MRRFILKRIEDVHGKSGVGVVAEGCEFENGSVALTWMSSHWSGTWFNSVHELKRIHSHGGKTKIVWVDEPTPDDVEEIMIDDGNGGTIEKPMMPEELNDE